MIKICQIIWNSRLRERGRVGGSGLSRANASEGLQVGLQVAEVGWAVPCLCSRYILPSVLVLVLVLVVGLVLVL